MHFLGCFWAFVGRMNLDGVSWLTEYDGGVAGCGRLGCGGLGCAIGNGECSCSGEVGDEDSMEQKGSSVL